MNRAQKQLAEMMATHNTLKAKAKRWRDMTEAERSEVRRLSSSWLMNTIAESSLIGRNSKGEFCNYGE